MRSRAGALALAAAVVLSSCGGSDPDPDPEPMHFLTVISVASSRGVGNVSGCGIDCTFTRTVASGTCSLEIAEGASVTLTATPSGEAEFDAWGGDCTGATCTVVMLADRTVTARFVNAFTVEVAPAAGAAGSGTVTSNPAGIDCTLTAGVTTGTCIAAFPDETAVILSVTVPAGSSFLGWGGDAGTCAVQAQCVVPLTASHLITASLGLDP